MDIERLQELADQIGFDHIGIVNMDALNPLSEVRQMCAADRCTRYGHSWSCPPACVSLEKALKQMHSYRTGILVQSTAQMSDEFDLNTIWETEHLHKKKFETLVRQARIFEPGCMPMASGSCTICHRCTYPKRPCRHPQKMIPSMEAYGLWVSDVCVKSNLNYNYGPDTVTYTACILINKKDDSL